MDQQRYLSDDLICHLQIEKFEDGGHNCLWVSAQVFKTHGHDLTLFVLLCLYSPLFMNCPLLEYLLRCALEIFRHDEPVFGRIHHACHYALRMSDDMNVPGVREV